MENRALKWSFCRHQSLINVRHASIRSFKPAMAFETFELTSDYTLIKSLYCDFMVCWLDELVGTVKLPVELSVDRLSESKRNPKSQMTYKWQTNDVI